MNDNDIIKGLENCTSKHTSTTCWDCPYKAKEIGRYGDIVCTGAMLRDSLALINSQKAEIERCHKEFEELNLIEEEQREEALENAKRNAELFNSAVKHARAEAIKEFAERLKKKECTLSADSFCCIKYIPRKELDNLVKEMVGEGN